MHLTAAMLFGNYYTRTRVYSMYTIGWLKLTELDSSTRIVFALNSPTRYNKQPYTMNIFFPTFY